jgi:hypothetical protein
MMPNCVTRSSHRFDEARIGRGAFSDEKKGGADAFLRQCRQHTLCRGGKWSVIESQDNLVIGEREGVGKAFEADTREALSVHGEDARSPEAILAWTVDGFGNNRRSDQYRHDDEGCSEQEHQIIPVTLADEWSLGPAIHL